MSDCAVNGNSLILASVVCFFVYNPAIGLTLTSGGLLSMWYSSSSTDGDRGDPGLHVNYKNRVYHETTF